ncbi:helix-turn-helix domain-containing protein [Streptococcus sanguinis]|nr:helix-turn-helix transcriptional regulator [Streptococcus sanguinis]
MDRLSNNIKSLRKSMGETQEDLAYSLDLNSKTAIANWESGENRPSPENLKKIADHYKVTVDQLLEMDLDSDFSFPKHINACLGNDNYKLIHSFLCLFPIVTVKKEQELYPILIDAQSFHKQFLVCLNNDNDDYFCYFEKAMELYEEVGKKNDIISAKANMLSILLLFLCLIVECTEFEGIYEMLEIKNQTLRRKAIRRFITEDYLSRSFKSSDRLKQEFDEYFYKDIMETIKELKGDNKLFELGDYYHCLLYIFDIVDNDLNIAINRQIGSALLSDLELMKNKYIQRFKYFASEIRKVQQS